MKKHTMLGIEGDMHYQKPGEDGLITSQVFKATRLDKEERRVTVEVRFDDSCHNRHESLSITVSHVDGGGADHEMVQAVFPELQWILPYHLCSTEGPMHYMTNTVWHAGDRDCWGGRNGDVRFTDYYVGADRWNLLVDYPEEKHRIIGPKVRKFNTREEAEEAAEQKGLKVIDHVTQYHEGKEPDLDAARRGAIWPDATDAELMQEPKQLREQLRKRLPMVQGEFLAWMVMAGFQLPALWRVGRDGHPLGFHRSEADALHQLHNLCPASADHATTHEGYTMEVMG